MFAVLLDQIHHRLAAVARFAVDMLEQMQRVRRVLIEGGHVILLQFNQRFLAQQAEQCLQTGRGFSIDTRFLNQQGLRFIQMVYPCLLGIGEQ